MAAAVLGASLAVACTDERLIDEDYRAGSQPNVILFLADPQRFGNRKVLVPQQRQRVRTEVYCHFPHSIEATQNVAATSLRSEDWKLIRFYADAPDGGERCELYHLSTDPGESADLAAARPDQVRELGRLIDEHLRDTGGRLPVANPDFSPASAP